ncbi:hypothetical protein [Marinovum sp. KMM 9879]
MKLGYLYIPPVRTDWSQARMQAHTKTATHAENRAALARALGFSEFYAAAPELAETAQPSSAVGIQTGPQTGPTSGLEHQPLLRILPDLSVQTLPQLIAVDGVARPHSAHAPGPLAAPVESVSDVQAQSFRGRAPLSVSWLDTDTLARHWAAHVTGCTHAARCARRQDWRVARTVIVNEDAARAEAAAKDANSPCRAYYRKSLAPGADDAAIDARIDACVLYGTAAKVMAQLAELAEASATFGTLTFVDHAWPDAAMACRSMTLFAGAVLHTQHAPSHRKTRKLEHA